MRARPATVAVLAALVLVAVVLALVVRTVVRDQESNLLDQRAREAGTYVESLAASVEVSLSAASGLALLASTPELFGSIVGELTGVLHDVVLVDTQPAEPVVVAGASPLLPVDAALSGPRADTVRAADDSMAVTPVVPVDGARHIGFALGVPGHPDRAVYVEFAFDLAQSALGDGEPFAELDAALYASTEASPEQLVLVSGSTAVPAGTVGRAEVTVGQATWLLEVASRTPLMGGVARSTPWIVLGAGLAVAILTAVLVEALLRRQSYALALVAERTAELEAAQEELRAADAMKDDFLATVSHELRTPLTAVSGFAGLLLREEDYDEQTRAQLLQGIARNASEMTGMVERLLDDARLTAGRVQFEPHPLQLRAEVGAAVAAHDHVLAGRDVRVDIDGDLWVHADAACLAHILGNLLSNAAKFSPAATPVDVTAAQAGDEVVVRVVDRGPGVAPDQAEGLFARYAQGARHGDGRPVKGLGLGLAIARRYAELHGGRIWFDVTDGARGSVAFTLPADEPPIPGPHATPAADHAPA